MTPTRSLPLIVIALVLATVIAHARIVIGGDTWDDVAYHTEIAPPRLAAAAQVHAGGLPSWWEGAGLGVPLWGEPSHGAISPASWIATTPRGLDLSLVVQLLWAALGVALWARVRVRPATSSASDPAALVAGAMIVTSGLLTSAALRGALPALASLPWIGACASWLVAASAISRVVDEAGDDAGLAAVARRHRWYAAAALGALIGWVGLAGQLAVLLHAVVIAIVFGARRRTARLLVVAIVAGLAIAAAQWLPAILQLGEGAGGVVHELRWSRLLELIVPGSFGSSDPARGVVELAGEAAWAPSLFVGAPLLALAAVRVPPRRRLVAGAALVVAALIAGRGGWPAWLGAPELHLATLVLVLAASSASGVDALVAGQRRAWRALAAGAGCTLVALVALAALRARAPAAEVAIDRALLEGGLGLLCIVVVIGIGWRAPGRPLGRGAPLVLALLVLPGVGAMRSLAPTTSRDVVAQPAWARATEGALPPVRVFRPMFMHPHVEAVADAIATFAGSSGSRWAIATANTRDPARPVAHDRVWLAAAREGGALLDRFGIALAILPETLLLPRKLVALGRRGTWALVGLPVAPAAAVLRGWRWAADPEDAIGLLFAAGGGTHVLRGTVVLRGAGEAGSDKGPPVACTIDGWAPGALDVSCQTEHAGYAVVSSSPSAGWSVTVDDVAQPWWTADVLRRAVRVEPGSHVVRWRYATPGGGAGLGLAGLGGLVLVGLALLGRFGRRARTAP